MPIADEDARTAARLARLDLPEEDLRTYAAQLSAVLDCFGAMSRLDTAQVPPMHHPVEVETAFRRDVPGDSLKPAAALGGAPCAKVGLFVVPKIRPDPGAGS
jgi:aspartyl-tRNA(Asn)/glutamyl-tRNA(Gln) amidotransferase subunit C